MTRLKQIDDMVLINAIEKMTATATCVGCGCDDNHACVNECHEACYWLRVNRTTGFGVCSQCAEFIDADIDSKIKRPVITKIQSFRESTTCRTEEQQCENEN